MSASRQLREGGYSLTFILVFLGIIGAVNYLADQYNKTWDATSRQLYSLSDQTQRVLDDLESDVTIYYFDRVANFPQAEFDLEKYENASSRVNVRYVDVDAEPMLAEEMNVTAYGETVVEVGTRRERLSRLSEQELTNAIIQAVKRRERTACFLSGHGEADLSNDAREGLAVVNEALGTANIEVRTLSLVENPDIPADCSVVLIVGPDAGYLPAEIEVLRNYVAGGGRLLLALDHAKSPELAELAGEWGVEVTDDIVLDLSGINQLLGGTPLTPFVANYPSHPITDVMEGKATLFPSVRGVRPADDTGEWDVTTLLETSEASFATSNLDIQDQELVRHPEDEREGPISIAVAATKSVEAAESEEASAPEGEEEAEAVADESQARVIVVGASRFARNYVVGAAGNRDLFLNMVNWLTSDEDLISIRPKDPESTPIELTRSDLTRIWIGLFVCVPLAIVLAGLRTWWLRR